MNHRLESTKNKQKSSLSEMEEIYCIEAYVQEFSDTFENMSLKDPSRSDPSQDDIDQRLSAFGTVNVFFFCGFITFPLSRSMKQTKQVRSIKMILAKLPHTV